MFLWFAAHGSLTPANILLQVPPSARIDEPQSAMDERRAAAMAAAALDEEQCMAKIANFGLSVQMRRGVTRASNVKVGAERSQTSDSCREPAAWSSHKICMLWVVNGVSAQSVHRALEQAGVCASGLLHPVALLSSHLVAPLAGQLASRVGYAYALHASRAGSACHATCV